MVALTVVFIVVGEREASVVGRSVGVASVVVVDCVVVVVGCGVVVVDCVFVVVEVPARVFVFPTVSAVVAGALPVLVMEPEFAD